MICPLPINNWLFSIATLNRQRVPHSPVFSWCIQTVNGASFQSSCSICSDKMKEAVRGPGSPFMIFIYLYRYYNIKSLHMTHHMTFFLKHIVISMDSHHFRQANFAEMTKEYWVDHGIIGQPIVVDLIRIHIICSMYTYIYIHVYILINTYLLTYLFTYLHTYIH